MAHERSRLGQVPDVPEKKKGDRSLDVETGPRSAGSPL